MNRHQACAALADYHIDTFARTYGVDPQDLQSDWSLWYGLYDALSDKELYIELYKLHQTIEFIGRTLPVEAWPRFPSLEHGGPRSSGAEFEYQPENTGFHCGGNSKTRTNVSES